MDALVKIDEPQDIRITMTLTLSLGSWQKLREQLKDSNWKWPANDITAKVDELVGTFYKEFGLEAVAEKEV